MNGPSRRRQFVSEPIEPVAGSFDGAALAAGEPALPTRFVWRGATYEVARVHETWKTTGPSRESQRERYLRKHWFRVETTDGTQMEIYFDRQARTRNAKQRWWLATIVGPTAEEPIIVEPTADEGLPVAGQGLPTGEPPPSAGR